MRNTSALLGTLALVLGACGTTGAEDGATTTTVADAITTTTLERVTNDTSDDGTTAPSSSPDQEIDAGMAPLIEMAVADLAERLEVSPDDVEVLAARLVSWADSSLGCPEPDRVYLPAVVDGSVIQLGVAGEVYSYHTGGDVYEPFLCEQPSYEGSSYDSALDGTPLELDKPIDKYPDETVPPPGYDD